MSSPADERLSDRAPDERRRLDGREVAIAAGAAAVVAVVYVAITAAHGALGAARNDDWSYLTVAYRFAQNGRFHLDGWASMMLVGQLVMAWPIIKVFGPHIVPLQLTVTFLAAVGLWGCYLLLRTFLSWGWAALAVGCLALGPVFGILSVSFMTDVPSFTFQILTLLVGLRALRTRRPSLPWFAAALGVGIVAFSIREYAVAAAAAVTLVVAWRVWTGARDLLSRIGAVVGVWLVIAIALYLWRRQLPHALNFTSDLSTAGAHRAADSLGHAVFSLALFVAPATLTISPFRLARAAWDRARVAAIVVIGLGIVLTAAAKPQFVGNYFTRLSSYTQVLPGSAPAVVPRPLWDVLGLVAFASLLMLLLLAVVAVADWRHDRGPRPLSGWSDGQLLAAVFCGLSFLTTAVVVSSTDAPFFDRYLITIVPFVAALVIKLGQDHRFVAARATLAAGVGIVVLGLIGFVWIDASATFDGGRWRLAQSLVDQGYAPATVDGGLDWFGYHQPDDVHVRPAVDGVNFWVSDFGPRPVCVTLTMPGATTRGTGADPQVIEQRTARSLFGVDFHFSAIAGPQHCDPNKPSP